MPQGRPEPDRPASQEQEAKGTAAATGAAVGCLGIGGLPIFLTILVVLGIVLVLWILGVFTRGAG
jgi:hypothetical protein